MRADFLIEATDDSVRESGLEMPKSYSKWLVHNVQIGYAEGCSAIAVLGRFEQPLHFRWRYPHDPLHDCVDGVDLVHARIRR